MRAIRSAMGAAFLAVTISSPQGANPARALAAPSACTLLSRPDVLEAVGIPVGEGVARVADGDVTSCSFAGERGGQVSILVRRASAGDWVSGQIERMNRGVQLGTYRVAPAIGERAYLYVLPKAGAVLCTFDADYYVQVSLLRMRDDIRIPAALEELAAIALARLRPAA